MATIEYFDGDHGVGDDAGMIVGLFADGGTKGVWGGAADGSALVAIPGCGR